MKKNIFVEDETIKIIEHRRKFLSLATEEHEINIPVHLIKLVQKAYTDLGGTQSIAIFLDTEDEFYITYEELENIDSVFEQFVDLKERTGKFRVEIYNIDTAKTIDK